MTDLVPVDQIEKLVEHRRHAINHIARADSVNQTVYLLHPHQCSAKLEELDLRECRYSKALDLGIPRGRWARYQDRPVVVYVGKNSRLLPLMALQADPSLSRRPIPQEAILTGAVSMAASEYPKLSWDQLLNEDQEYYISLSSTALNAAEAQLYAHWQTIQ